jgi:hypothetical protein
MGAEVGRGGSVSREKVCVPRGFVRMVGSRRWECDEWGWCVGVVLLFFFRW